MAISEQPAQAQTGNAANTSGSGSLVATAGSLLGALILTSCCILPLALISFGVGGVWIAQLSVLSAYKWYTLAIAVGFIGYGFWKVYRAEAGECQDGEACARPLNRQLMKASLWLAAVATAISIMFPYMAPYILKF